MYIYMKRHTANKTGDKNLFCFSFVSISVPDSSPCMQRLKNAKSKVMTPTVGKEMKEMKQS
jgi:hypothetical protein